MAGDENLHVDPNALGTYGMHMLLYAASAAIPITSPLSSVEVDSTEAFSGSSGFQVGVFAEGPIMQAAMAKQAAAFTSFANDLTRGLTAIAYAADVCAYAYNSTDVESAEKMNLLGYAFATDPDAKRPTGLPKGTGKTISDQAEAGGDAAAMPDALANPDSGNTVQVYSSGWLTTYADGSTKMVHTEDVAGKPSASRAVTTLYGKDGQVLRVTTTETQYRADGTSSEYYRQEKTPSQKVAGADGKSQKTDPVTVTTKTSAAAGGGSNVETSSQVGSAKPTVTKTYVPPATHTPAATDGPVQEATSTLGLDAGQVDWKKGYQGVQAPS